MQQSLVLAFREAVSTAGQLPQLCLIKYDHSAAPGTDRLVISLLDKAGVEPDEGVVVLDGFAKAATQRYWNREPRMRPMA